MPAAPDLNRLRATLSGADGVIVLLAVVVIGVGAVRPLASTWAPVALHVGPLVAGALLLSLSRFRVLCLVVAAVIGADALLGRLAESDLPSLAAVLAVGAYGHEAARRRDRLGLPAMRSEAMLVELRDRLRAQGEVPALPPGWRVEVSQRSAGGVAFAGDFLTSSLIPATAEREPMLELSLVDVSGKGLAAGTRALLLSGALGGLLGAVPPDRFLVEANRYLVRQDWPEGFATAVHVTINLTCGEFFVQSAGHPPAVQFASGSGTWSVLHVDGPLLGVLPGVGYVQRRGRLAPGDALVMYTDGLVEVPGRDIEVGLDRLIGAAERLVPRGGFAGCAERLVDEVAPGALDDSALVLIWRT